MVGGLLRRHLFCRPSCGSVQTAHEAPNKSAFRQKGFGGGLEATLVEEPVVHRPAAIFSAAQKLFSIAPVRPCAIDGLEIGLV